MTNPTTPNQTPGSSTPNKQENPNTPVVPGPSVENRKRGDEVPEVDPTTGLAPVPGLEHEPAPDTGVQPDGSYPDDRDKMAKGEQGKVGPGVSDKR